MEIRSARGILIYSEWQGLNSIRRPWYVHVHEMLTYITKPQMAILQSENLVFHLGYIDGSEQTVRIRRLSMLFAEFTCLPNFLLILLCCGSIMLRISRRIIAPRPTGNVG